MKVFFGDNENARTVEAELLAIMDELQNVSLRLVTYRTGSSSRTRKDGYKVTPTLYG